MDLTPDQAVDRALWLQRQAEHRHEMDQRQREREMWAWHDRMVFGTSFAMLDGTRVDPRRVRPSR